METLIAVAHHRNQYYSGCRNGNNPMKFGPSSSRGFRDVNCRAFEGGIGLLPSPSKGYGSPVSTRGLLARKPLNPCGGVGRGVSKSEDVKTKSKKMSSSSPIAINFDGRGGSLKERESREDLLLLERWAGPAYSNSPPPSSLPMPKFDVTPKRTVSLELPAFESDLNLPPMSKSAPTSPTNKSPRSSVDFFSDDDCATRTLRRILNLDIVDD
ncbi:hypothetical protein RND81_02G012900 [Saponaria officinalis]|uniref:Uncharacterized protein n=1 Tax=Saponaria officinalis TaxID=3572 RepID=A0AAW1MJE1_SAPOF